ncbi:hypothetical protein ILYODFUR_006534 [Ilyodon furcidens]|uniref:Uncharacterized protein n=1 Tax=Ilyodon furcidens TaxID=33524 RepID=A0ABV0T5U8_9TELE
MCKQSSWERAETTTSFLQRTAELTGFHRNNKEKIERQRGGGEVDLQIKLSSRPVKKPCSHISLCEGETRSSQKPSWLFLLALERNKKKKERWRKREKGLPSHLFAALPLTVPYQSKSAHLSARQL